jgi:putative FmdB family regulatory protein
MPIYEYRCESCDTRFERFVRAFGESAACPECRSEATEKLLSTFAMGSGSGAAAAGPSSPGRCCGGGCGCAH